MRTRQKSAFQKVGECLYRYSSNGVYYARFESSGKEIRRSLRTTDRTSAQRALAWLKQEREQIDPTQGKLTLAELCDRYSATIQHRIIATSPAAHLRYAKRQKRIRATPNFEEFKAIVETIRSQKYNGHDAEESADFVEFLGLAGLGKAQAAVLRQSDIDWQRETITTFSHKTKSGFAIPIYPQLKPLLLRRRRADAPNERVFKINDAKRAIANACHRLNMPQYSHISFRRMFITRAIERGVDVKVISEWQGHKDGGKLILDTYSHVNRAHSHRMAQLMTDGLPENGVPITAGVSR